MAAEDFGLHFREGGGAAHEAVGDAVDGFRQAQGEAGADEFRVAGVGDLLGVVVENGFQIPFERLLLKLAAGEALDGFLHGAEFVEAFADAGEAVFHRLPGALGELRFVGEHGADGDELVGENGGIRPCDFPQRGDEGGSVGVEMDGAPPVPARGFIEPMAFQQFFQKQPRLLAGRACGLAAVLLIELEVRVALQRIGDEQDDFLARDSIGPVGGLRLQRVESIDVEGRVASRQDTEKPGSAGLAEKGGGEMLGGHAGRWRRIKSGT